MAGELSPTQEKRIKEIALLYYSRQDIQKAIFNFSQKRETVPNYLMESFGKRPDALQYPSDVLGFVGKGATSFHTSEEIWNDPLQISRDFSEEEFNKLRAGWDLLIDIDCKWIEYSKKAAKALIEAFNFHGVKNIGIKFSGSKGFHLIVPWKSFPKEIYDKKTCDMFPEWPRMICQYIMEVARPILEKDMESEDIKFLNKLEGGMICTSCKKIADELIRRTVFCPVCKREETSEVIREKKNVKCPDCRIEMREKNRNVYYKCPSCESLSSESPDKFRSAIDIFKVLGVDVVLVSSRHLFRAPYSLHEKTALASVVLDREELDRFQIQDANPLRVKAKEFYPVAQEDEARELLVQAIDWDKSRQQEQPSQKQPSSGEFKEIKIKDLSPNLYPPCITNILNGVKQDGRKRALFILLNFFKSLKLPEEEIEKRIADWNNKNYKPLKVGYLKSQFEWHARQKPMLPPNCVRDHYKAIAVCKPDNLCKVVKNPVNYSIKKSFALSKSKRKKRKGFK